jgi:acetylglutamate kinase
MDAVVQIFAGLVNTQLVAALAEAGARPVGLTGADAGLVHAVPLSPELGNVGKINRTNPEILNVLTNHGFLPVVACLAGGAQGELYNVNADQMAVACAVAFQAGRLIFLTDVEGVLDAEKRRLPSLTGAEALALIERGVAAGGMEAKLRACLAAVGQGVEAVQIAPGANPGVLEELLAGCPVGTTVHAA